MGRTISIHALREEGDPYSSGSFFGVMLRFLSTPSARRATQGCARQAGEAPISIHALREEGDVDHPRGGQVNGLISIHALREEGDSPPPIKTAITSRFLSTPSARRATPRRLSARPGSLYFYPRPPRGGRPGDCTRDLRAVQISIHALREEGDTAIQNFSGLSARFLSTPSARRATADAVYFPNQQMDFYPRPPRGGRLVESATAVSLMQFLSTPSARRATHDPAAP